jgi:putative ABC transport system permease protein
MSARRQVSIVQGRMFRFGTNEVIVGRAANSQFMDMNVGDTIVSGQNRWQIVGTFEADGGVAETEVRVDARTLQSAYRRATPTRRSSRSSSRSRCSTASATG